MTAEPVAPRLWRIRHYAEVTTDAGHARAEVTAILRDMIRREGYVLDDDSITAGTPVAICLAGTADGYAIHSDTGDAANQGPHEPDGHITEWSASAFERFSDDVRAGITTTDDGKVRAEIPRVQWATGGGIRVAHALDGPVTVYAFRPDGTPIGYLFSQPLTPNEEHVEFLPGTGYLTVERDPEDETEGD